MVVMDQALGLLRPHRLDYAGAVPLPKLHNLGGDGPALHLLHRDGHRIKSSDGQPDGCELVGLVDCLLIPFI